MGRGGAGGLWRGATSMNPLLFKSNHTSSSVCRHLARLETAFRDFFARTFFVLGSGTISLACDFKVSSIYCCIALSCSSTTPRNSLFNCREKNCNSLFKMSRRSFCHDVGALIGEQHTGKRSCNVLAEIDHADTRECTGPTCPPL